MLDVGPFVGGRVLERDDGSRGQIVDVEAGQQIVNDLRKAGVVADDEQRLDRSGLRRDDLDDARRLGEVQPPLERNRGAGVVARTLRRAARFAACASRGSRESGSG